MDALTKSLNQESYVDVSALLHILVHKPEVISCTALQFSPFKWTSKQVLGLSIKEEPGAVSWAP